MCLNRISMTQTIRNIVIARAQHRSPVESAIMGIHPGALRVER